MTGLQTQTNKHTHDVHGSNIQELLSLPVHFSSPSFRFFYCKHKSDRVCSCLSPPSLLSHSVEGMAFSSTSDLADELEAEFRCKGKDEQEEFLGDMTEECLVCKAFLDHGCSDGDDQEIGDKRRDQCTTETDAVLFDPVGFRPQIHRHIEGTVVVFFFCVFGLRVCHTERAIVHRVFSVSHHCVTKLLYSS